MDFFVHGKWVFCFPFKFTINASTYIMWFENWDDWLGYLYSYNYSYIRNFQKTFHIYHMYLAFLLYAHAYQIETHIRSTQLASLQCGFFILFKYFYVWTLKITIIALISLVLCEVIICVSISLYISISLVFKSGFTLVRSFEHSSTTLI